MIIVIKGKQTFYAKLTNLCIFIMETIINGKISEEMKIVHHLCEKD